MMLEVQKREEERLAVKMDENRLKVLTDEDFDSYELLCLNYLSKMNALMEKCVDLVCEQAGVSSSVFIATLNKMKKSPKFKDQVALIA